MTVQELISRLNWIEDKTKIVLVGNLDGDWAALDHIAEADPDDPLFPNHVYLEPKAY